MAEERRQKTTMGRQEEMGENRERTLDGISASRRPSDNDRQEEMEVGNLPSHTNDKTTAYRGYYGTAGRPRSIRIELPRKQPPVNTNTENAQNEQFEHVPYTREEILSALTDIGIKKEMLQGLEIVRDSVTFVVFSQYGDRNRFLDKKITLRESTLNLSHPNPNFNRRTYGRRDTSKFIRVYGYPIDAEDRDLTTVLKQYGTFTKDVWEVVDTHGLATGARSAIMELTKDIPSFLYIGKYQVRITYKDQPQTCRKCYQTGHIAKNCTKEVTCKACGSNDHGKRECPNKICFYCGKSGHTMYECTGEDSDNEDPPRRDPQNPWNTPTPTPTDSGNMLLNLGHFPPLRLETTAPTSTEKENPQAITPNVTTEQVEQTNEEQQNNSEDVRQTNEDHNLIMETTEQEQSHLYPENTETTTQNTLPPTQIPPPIPIAENTPKPNPTPTHNINEPSLSNTTPTGSQKTPTTTRIRTRQSKDHGESSDSDRTITEDQRSNNGEDTEPDNTDGEWTMVGGKHKMKLSPKRRNRGDKKRKKGEVIVAMGRSRLSYN